MLDRLPKFYDTQTEKFVIIILTQHVDSDIYVTHMLGEEVENPKCTFRSVESLLEVFFGYIGQN